MTDLCFGVYALFGLNNTRVELLPVRYQFGVTAGLRKALFKQAIFFVKSNAQFSNVIDYVVLLSNPPYWKTPRASLSPINCRSFSVW